MPASFSERLLLKSDCPYATHKRPSEMLSGAASMDDHDDRDALCADWKLILAHGEVTCPIGCAARQGAFALVGRGAAFARCARSPAFGLVSGAWRRRAAARVGRQ